MTEKAPAPLPSTLEDLIDYIVYNADRIYVREEIDGKVDSYALTDLPAELAIFHALRFIRERRIPKPL
jgi:hypothetical protein